MEFRDQYWFLSNFYPAPITIQGITYPTSEHAYQAAKTTNLVVRREIAALNTPGQAKRFGKRIPLRADWEDIKLQAMRYIVLVKFTNPALKAKLIATGHVELVEGNAWGDTFWGSCNGRGENHLGKILMAVRTLYQMTSENPERAWSKTA